MPRRRRNPFELLTLRRPTVVTDLYNCVPKPDGAVPKNGLPVWDELMLEAKLPIGKAPKGAVIFSRGKVGQKLWRSSGGTMEFDLSDPNCLDVSYTYHPLHDENLQHFFRRKANRLWVQKLGLITESGEAMCTLREFNEYRRYLKNVYLDALHKERTRQEEIATEKRDLGIARLNGRKEIEKVALQKKTAERSQLLGQQLQGQNQEKQERIAKRQQRDDHRYSVMAERKAVENAARVAKGNAFKMRILDRINQAKILERKKKIEAMKQWHQNSVWRERQMYYRKKEKQLAIELQEATHWRDKIRNQIDYAVKAQNLLRQHEEDMQVKVIMRNLMVQKERNKLDELFYRIKAERLLLQKKDHGQALDPEKKKRVMEAIIKAWEAAPDKDTKEFTKSVADRLEAIIREIESVPQRSLTVFSIMQGVKEGLYREKETPLDVKIVIDEALERAIAEFIRKNVLQLFTEVSQMVMQHSKRLFQAPRKSTMKDRKQSQDTSLTKSSSTNKPPSKRTSKTLDMIKSTESINDGTARVRSNANSERRRSSISAIYSAAAKIASDLRLQRIVSFGAVETIAQIQAGDNLQSIKTRRPTPVPSLTELAEAVFQDPLPAADDESDSLTGEKEKLMRLFKTLSKVLFKRVLLMAEKNRKAFQKHRSKKYKNADNAVSEAAKKLADAIMTMDEESLLQCKAIDEIELMLFKDFVKNFRKRPPRHEKGYSAVDNKQSTVNR